MQNNVNFKKAAKKAVKDLVLEIKEQQSKIGIFSTSANPQELSDSIPPHFTNMLMWAHYGDSFKGFAICFDSDLFYNSLQEINQDKKIAYSKVDYVDAPVDLEKAFDGDLRQASSNMLKSLQYKHQSWGYECEYRYLSNSIGLHSYSPESVKCIFLGEKMPPEQKILIKRIADSISESIKVYDLSIVRNSTKFEIQRSICEG
ncbi:MAG: DUF2971 domain-containing protein [Aestuariibacter sp.]